MAEKCGKSAAARMRRGIFSAFEEHRSASSSVEMRRSIARWDDGEMGRRDGLDENGRDALAGDWRRTNEEAGWRCRTTTMRLGLGRGGSQLHHDDDAAATATGAAECMTMQSWQWSASVAFACWCATWATASSASRTRHRTATAGKKPCQALRFPRKYALNPVNRWSPLFSILQKIRIYWTR